MIAVTDKMLVRWALDAWYNENLTLAGLEDIIGELKNQCETIEEVHMLDYLLDVVR